MYFVTHSYSYILRSSVLAIALSVTSAFAEVITVDDDGKADFASIQAAVDYASDGDEILVAPGVYTSDHPAHVVNMLGKAITLRASAGPEVTIIDGEGLRRGIVCINDETADTIIQGFTIQNGFGVAYDADESGSIDWWEESGREMLSRASSPTLEDCTFIGAEDTAVGGNYAMINTYGSPTLSRCSFSIESGHGMYSYSANLTLIDCTFTGTNSKEILRLGLVSWANRASISRCTFTNLAPGIWNEGNTGEDSSAILTDCTFSENNLGMYNGGSEVDLSNCTFIRNSSAPEDVPTGSDAGGMCNADSEVLLSNCTFTENSSTPGSCLPFEPYGGGAIDNSWSDVTLIGCSFTDNWSLCNGGAITNNYGSQTLIDCTFTGNNARFSGGGMFSERNNLSMTDCTFTGNMADDGGAMAADRSTQTLTDCAFTNNTAADWDNPSNGYLAHGGGIAAIDCETSVISCLFEANEAVPSSVLTRPSMGGAIYLAGGDSDLSLDNSLFRNNSSQFGGALYDSSDRSITITNCTFANNSASFPGSNWGSLSEIKPGGAIMGYRLRLSNTVFCGNMPNPFSSADWTDNGGNCVSLLCNDTDGDGRADCYGNGIDDFLSVPDEYPTIESAIDAAAEGALIEIAAGTYAPVITLDTLGKAITLRGAIDSQGNSTTIIDGQGIMRVLQCVSGEDSATVFENLIITGGNAGNGGGMLNAGGQTYGGDLIISRPTLINCSFRDNRAQYDGGGMFNYESSPTLTNTVLCSNTPDQIDGDWTDNGGNTIATSCDCPTDINGDGIVNGADLTFLFGFWGSNDAVADVNSDGIVDGADLTVMLDAWGACP